MRRYSVLVAAALALLIAAVTGMAGLLGSPPATAKASTGYGAQGTEVDAYPSNAYNGKTFYPFVKDGYRDVFSVEVDFYSDYTGCSYGSNGYTWHAELRSSTGTLVHQYSGSESYDNSRYLNWNGTKLDGTTKVPVGNYFDLTVTADFNCDDGSTDEVQTTVADIHPITGYRTVKHTIKRWGRYATSHGTSGWCLSTPDGYGWSLNCAGTSGSAWVTYRVALPTGGVWAGWAFEDDWNGPVYYSHTDAGRYRTFEAKIGGYSWADATTPVVFWYKLTVAI